MCIRDRIGTVVRKNQDRGLFLNIAENAGVDLSDLPPDLSIKKLVRAVMKSASNQGNIVFRSWLDELSKEPNYRAIQADITTFRADVEAEMAKKIPKDPATGKIPIST